MMRVTLSVAGLVAALAVAGCNETAGGAMAGPDPAAPPAAVAFALPRGAACSKEIDRFEIVVGADLATGNVEQQVYDRIQADMKRAARACSAGHGGESHSIVAASKARNGYRG